MIRVLDERISEVGNLIYHTDVYLGRTSHSRAVLRVLFPFQTCPYSSQMASKSMSGKPVVFIGAADVICAQAVQFFAAACEAPIVLADPAGEDAIRQATAKVAAGRATARKVDIFDPSALSQIITGASLVVNGLQPYYSTSPPVIRACIDAKIPYLDFSDDVKSTQDSLLLSEEAKKQGVPCYINCGAAPGMSNLMALDAARELDTVNTIDVCWYVSDQGGANGKEVLEHLMHITAGPCLTWANGKAAVNENWVETVHTPIGPGGRDVILHETVHPEPVTLPRAFPNASRIRCVGALNPAPFNGFARGLSKAVRSGALTMDGAIDFLWNLATKQGSNQGSLGGAFSAIAAELRRGDITLNQLYQLVSQTAGSLDPWRHAIWGMIEQIRDGECSTMDVVRFMINSASGKHAPNESGMLVRIHGIRNGCPAEIIRRRPAAGQVAMNHNMAAEIGSSCATFMLVVLQTELGTHTRAGVHCPEDWADPQVFFKTMEQLGLRPEEIVEYS